jgi:predicted hotdog family 3-hydroxylacyl-ACP dehydratase
MLLIDRLICRDREVDSAKVEAFVPEAGVFVDPEGELLPEYFIELVAQSMAAVNGYDCRLDGLGSGRGFLVGVDDFFWQGGVAPGETMTIEMAKIFEFGAVTVMSGRVINKAGEVLAGGEIKAWEEK